ncbi:LysR family transcriptional regulator [Salinisphaera aquimarina]|uniref:LysR family transcriptional regulator n=1 Tax=Salinisphaera aquimarina TaxID=2094031 RepID=A0ABV7ERW4_9GAMM
MTDPIRLEALQALDAIERHGSFAGAAAALYRVPSAISYTISQLESELGVAVFDRSGHRAVLTPAGRLLLDEGRRILVATRELGAAARRLADNWEPELRLAIDGLIAPHQIWPSIDAFSRAHPAINVRLSEEVLAGTWEALVDERVDLAIGVADPPVMAGIHRAAYVEVAFLFCCAPQHPLARLGRPLTEDDRRAHRAIVVADSAHRFSPRSSSAGLLDGQPRLTVANMYSKVAALEQGLGVGYCPVAWVDDAITAGRLVTPPLATVREPSRAYLLWRSGGRGRALQWFIDHLSTQPACAGAMPIS